MRPNEKAALLLEHCADKIGKTLGLLNEAYSVLRTEIGRIHDAEVVDAVLLGSDVDPWEDDRDTTVERRTPVFDPEHRPS